MTFLKLALLQLATSQRYVGLTRNLNLQPENEFLLIVAAFQCSNNASCKPLMPTVLRRSRTVIASVLGMGALVIALGWTATHVNVNLSHTPGEAIDELDGVAVYYNGAMNHVQGRNVSSDGYNLGLRWQCVEFIKRYYFEHFGHRMPEARGNAKDFFDKRLGDGELNQARNLLQYSNSGLSTPALGDIIVFAPWLFNPYGHVAIVSKVEEGAIEVIQQNPGPFGVSRETHALVREGGHVTVGSGRVLGWLRRS